MAAAAGGPLGSVCTFFLPKIWSAFWQKQKLEIELKSLKTEHAHVLGSIQDWRLRGSHPGGTLDITQLRRMANEIEDCIERCHIAKTLCTRADLIRMIPDLKVRSQKLGEYYKTQQKSVSSSTEEKSTTSRHQGGSGGSGASGHGQSLSEGDSGVVKPSCTDPVDMDGAIEELLDLLKVKDGDPESKQLKVISISGFGGLGKTLLADQVYCHKDCARPHFTVRARVDAAGKSHDEVLEEILEQVFLTCVNDEEQVLRENGNQSANDKGNNQIDGVTRENGELGHGQATQPRISKRHRSSLKNKRANDKVNKVKIDGVRQQNGETGYGQATQPRISELLRSFLENKRANDNGMKVKIDGVTRQNGEPGHGQATQPRISELLRPFLENKSANDNGKKVKIDGVTRQNGEPGHAQATQPGISELLKSFVENKRANDKGKKVMIDGVTRQNGEPGNGQATQAGISELLRLFLENKRFLIVIVGIQENRGEIAIASVLKGFGEVHSRVIITTTIQSIATSWASPNNHLYPMSTLNKVHWEELFFKEFDEGKHKNSKEMGQLTSLKSLLEKCDGLPLALISTANVLSGTELDNQACTDAWKKLCDIKHDDTDTLQKMQRVLASTCAGLSGNNLPPTLIDCLLYFSMFPPNHHVRKNSLIRRWLAEGMKQNVGKKEFNFEEQIKRLIDRSIIQSMEVGRRGDMKGCKASSLMYDYIYHRSKSEEFMAVLSDVMDNGFEQKGYVRRLSIHATETGIAEERLPADLSHLHTLAVFGTEKPEVTKDLANGLLGKKRILANCLFGNKGILAKYKVLRVLDLKECAGLNGKHLQTICDLLLLKYLSLGDSIVQVPRKIAQLKLLETLDLSRTNVVTVYMEVLGLPSLTHLLGKFQLSKWDCILGMEKLKRFVRNKCKLDTLGGFTTGKSEAFPQLIGHMRQLKKVKIWIDPTADTRNLEHLRKGIKEFVREGRFESTVGYSLSVDFSECLQEHAERSLHFLTLPQTEKVNIRDNTQGAQSKQEGEANHCLGSNGDGTSKQIMKTQDSIKEHETEEIEAVKQGARSDYVSSRNETEIMQNHQNVREGYDKCPNKLSSLKLCGKLPKFPLQFVTAIAGIERLCLSSTGLSGKDITDAVSELPDLFYLKLHEDDLRPLDLQNKQFPSLQRVCFSVKDGNLPSPTIIQNFRNVREVYLYASLDYSARRSWKAASESHPERPRVFFGESKNQGTLSKAVTQNK